MSSLYSPISHARGLAMDLGFAGLLQEIEKRFGSLVANLTTFCLLILVASWTLEFVMSLYASGATIWRDGDTLGLVRMIIACGILLVATAFIGGQLSREPSIDRPKRLRRRSKHSVST